MQSDGRLIQNIQHTHQGGTDLCSQTNPLALAAGQRCRRACQGQVLQTHGIQKSQSIFDLLQDPLGDHLLSLAQFQPVNKLQFLSDAFLAECVNVHPTHRNCQGFPAQTAAFAGGTGTLAHALLQLTLHRIRLGFPVAALQIVANAFKGLIQGSLPSGLIVVEGQLFPVCAVEKHMDDFLRQIFDGGVQLKLVFLGQSIKIHSGNTVGFDAVPTGGGNCPFDQGQIPVGNDQIRIHLQLVSQTGTGGAGAEGIVEGEHTGRQFLNGHPAILAGIILGKQDIPVFPNHIDQHQSARQIGRNLHAVCQTPGNVLPDHQAVNHHFNVVLFILVQLDLLAQIVKGAIRPNADIAGLACILKHLDMLTLFSPDDRGHHLDTGSLGEGHHLINDLIHGLLFDLLAAHRAVGGSHTGPKQAQIVVDLRDSTHRGARILAGGLLVDGNGGRKAVNIVHIGLLHLSQEHTGVGAEGLHIPPLAFRINGVKGQRGLARSGQAGKHHQLVSGDLHINILQIVGARAFD